MLLQVLLALGLKLGGRIMEDRNLALWGRLAEDLADKIPEIIGKYGDSVAFDDIDWPALKMRKWDEIGP